MSWIDKGTCSSMKETGDTTFLLYVGVRDVVLVHLSAYKVPEVDGRCFATTLGSFTHQRVCDIIRSAAAGVGDR